MWLSSTPKLKQLGRTAKETYTSTTFFLQPVCFRGYVLPQTGYKGISIEVAAKAPHG
jgi:hypothetical protein